MVITVFGAAYAVQPAYGIGVPKDAFLWIPVLGNLVGVIVIPFVGALSDRIGRRPPFIAGALGSGAFCGAYLYAISMHNMPLAIAIALLSWGIIYQGYNAVFPCFYPELFQTRTRVSAMAISQNLGTAATAMLPALFAAVAPRPVQNRRNRVRRHLHRRLRRLECPRDVPHPYQRPRTARRRSNPENGI